VWFDPAGGAEPPDVAADSVVQLMITTRNRHGARRDIPAKYVNRPILATIRSPFDRYVSQYEFAWWRIYPEMFGPIDETVRICPSYPDITFAEFLALTNQRMVAHGTASPSRQAPGHLTEQFMEHFFDDPRSALPRLNDSAFVAAAGQDLRARIRFLDQARLNEELAAFLEEMGYSPDEIEQVRSSRALPSAKEAAPGARSSTYYTPALKEYVRTTERCLFEWFPEFDV
jgi:hypothetical protein